jgi:hypothetical protein
MRLLCALVFVVLSAIPAAAQTFVSAESGVAFPASVDHDTLNQDGTPRLAGYTLRIVRFDNQTVLVFDVQLGKPTVPPNGEILVKPIAAFGALTRGVQHVARIVAYGPGGENASVASDPFVYPFDPPVAPTAPGAPRVVQ